MNIEELETKFLKKLTTKPQRETINKTIEGVMLKYGVKEGAALELICFYYLSGNPDIEMR